MQRSSVDLPEPDAPIRHTTSCSATRQSIPRSTSFFPNDLCTPSTESCGLGAHASPPACRRRRSRSVSQSVKRASGIVSRTKKNAATKYGV